VVLGRQGVEQVIEMELNDEERAMLDHSAAAVQSVVDVLGYD
jgi:malate dehydrogenase